MVADDADVTKALAAFGAPSIRYRSFGQSSGRMAAIVTPRRDMATPAPLPSNAEPGQAAVERPSDQDAPQSVSRQAAAAPSRPPRSLAEWAPPAEPTRAAPVAPSPVSRLSPVAAPPAGLAARRPLAADPLVRSIPGRTLAEVFALLASAPPGAPRALQATPEIFRQG